ncbi:unnamed protein product [Clonostachys solani]|uniref:Uncharacterized protein n=1 Tax=Clonostachys solani TaxID=160281 RepID=A0A9N9W8Q9_9HYPO|nr:unnamed protein product [Clonostachys solani]
MYSKAVPIILVALAGSTAASLSSLQYDNDLVARAPELLSEELVTRSPMDPASAYDKIHKKGKDHAAGLVGGRKPHRRSDPVDIGRMHEIMAKKGKDNASGVIGSQASPSPSPSAYDKINKKGRDHAAGLVGGRKPHRRSPMDPSSAYDKINKKGRDHAAGLVGGRKPHRRSDPVDIGRMHDIMAKKGRDHAAGLVGGRKPHRRSPMDPASAYDKIHKKGKDHAAGLTGGRRPRNIGFMSKIKYHFVVTLSDLFQLEDNAHLAAKVKIKGYKVQETHQQCLAKKEEVKSKFE